jgi:hypothetical protein
MFFTTLPFSLTLERSFVRSSSELSQAKERHVTQQQQGIAQHQSSSAMNRVSRDDELGWADVTYQPTNRGTLEQQHTAYQQLLHKHALSRLEGELKHFVSTMPRRELPKYLEHVSDVAVIGRTGSMRSSSSSVPHLLATPTAASDLDDSSAKADRVYSRSAVQRYVLQLLAAELHAPLEQSRQEVPFETFREVLQAPNSVDLEKLNPKVVDRPLVETNPTEWKSPIGLTPPSLLRGSSQSNLMPPSLGSTTLTPSLQQHQAALNNGRRPTPAGDGDVSPLHDDQRRARVVVDSASFLNMSKGIRVRNFS